MSSTSAHDNLLNRLRGNRLQDQDEPEAVQPYIVGNAMMNTHSQRLHQDATAHFIRSSLAHFYRHQRGARPKRVA